MKQSKSLLQNKIKIGLSYLCVMLAAILWFEMNFTQSTDQEVDQSTRDTVSKSKNLNNQKSIFPELVAYDEIIQRPLFNETRQPFVASESEKALAKPKQKNNRTIKKQEQLSLSAVVITPDKQIAIFQSGRNKSLQRIALGELIDGWYLDEVSPHSVQLKKGEEIKNLELEIKGSKSKPENKSIAKTVSTVKAEMPQKQVLTEKEGVDNDSNTEAIVGKK